MEGFLDQHGKEHISVKKVMLKQEETFRHQVGLTSASDWNSDRPWRWCKILRFFWFLTWSSQVQELHRVYQIQKLLMKEAQPKHKPSEQTNQTNSDKWTPEHSDEPKVDAHEESDLELTLATGSRRTQWKKRSASYISDSGSGFSSTSGDSAGRRRPKKSDWALTHDSIRFGGERKNTGLKIEKMRQDELKQPSWLFLCNKQHSLVASLGLPWIKNLTIHSTMQKKGRSSVNTSTQKLVFSQVSVLLEMQVLNRPIKI